MRWGERWSGFWGGPSSAETRCTDARDRLQRKIRGGPNARAVACIVGTRYGEQAAAVLDVRHSVRNIGAAAGDLLDIVGRSMSLPRAGDDDARYRRALATWALCRGSFGTSEDILEVVRTWLGAGPTIALDMVFPMGFRLEIDSMPAEDLPRLIFFVGAAKATTYGAEIAITSDTTGLLVDTEAEDVVDAYLVDTEAEDVAGAGTVATIFDA